MHLDFTNKLIVFANNFAIEKNDKYENKIFLKKNCHIFWSLNKHKYLNYNTRNTIFQLLLVKQRQKEEKYKLPIEIWLIIFESISINVFNFIE
jgi:hypothetical protein